MNILVVEDNSDIAEAIGDYLSLLDYFLDYAVNGKAAIALIEKGAYYDVIIMDIMMPKMDGIAAVTYLREELFCNIPVLFLTGKDTLQDKTEAFNAGGDDYLLKPFALEELALRVQALAKRGHRQDVGTLSFASLTMNMKTMEVQQDGVPIKLNRIQTDILKLLIKRAPSLVSRNEITATIWGDNVPGSDALRSHIYSLRTALNTGKSRLETVHGQGYRLKSD